MHFRQSIDHSFRARGLTPQVRLEADAVHHLTQAVSAGLRCSVMPIPIDGTPSDGHLRLLPIEGAHTLAAQGLIMRRSAPASPLAQACFEEAREWLAS